MTDIEDAARRREFADHRRWVESQGKEGVKGSWYAEDLSGADLTGAVLCDAMLMEANFAGATLDRADLYGAFAGGASFTGASLVGANLGKAVLAGCSFENVNARGTRFSKTNLLDATFDNADLSTAILDGATCQRTSFARADLTGVSLITAGFHQVDLRGAKLAKARFDRTVFDHATRLDDCTGLETAEVITIVAGDQKLEGEAGRAWLLSRAQPLPWSVEDFELYLLSKMKGPRALEAAERLCPDAVRRAETTTGVARVFDAMPHAAVDYERVLGAPRERRPIVDPPQTFGESTRAEFVLPLWPEVMFGVNTDQDGLPWNIGFTGPAGVPGDPRAIEPWKWTAVRLEELATGFEVEEQWNHDLDAIVTFGADRFRATFVFGLLQSWSPA